MSESKPTPGPWEFRMYVGGCTIVSKHDEPGTSVRARLKGVTVKVDAVINDDQSNAHDASPDARLIAAAPEMYDALVALSSNPHLDLAGLVYEVRARELQGWDGPAVKAWSDAVMAAKAAIKKAKGEER